MHEVRSVCAAGSEPAPDDLLLFGQWLEREDDEIVRILVDTHALRPRGHHETQARRHENSKDKLLHLPPPPHTCMVTIGR